MARTKASSGKAPRKELPDGDGANAKRGPGRPKGTGRPKGPGRPAGKKQLSIEKDNWRLHKYTFAVYVYKVLRQVHPDCRISNRAMSIMESMMRDIFERLAHEASRLAKMRKTSIVQSRDIQTAVRLIFPGELAKHAVSEGTKAVAKYSASKTM